jgi:hypothetical protein
MKLKAKSFVPNARSSWTTLLCGWTSARSKSTSQPAANASCTVISLKEESKRRRLCGTPVRACSCTVQVWPSITRLTDARSLRLWRSSRSRRLNANPNPFACCSCKLAPSFSTSFSEPPEFLFSLWGFMLNFINLNRSKRKLSEGSGLCT